MCIRDRDNDNFETTATRVYGPEGLVSDLTHLQDKYYACLLYTSILQKTGSTKGTVNGLYAPDALQLSISAPDAVIPAGPLTRVYISSSETLYDVGQLYKNIRSSITGSYPLASLLLPDWSLGSYISQAQLASLLGVDTTATSLQDMTEFELPQKKLQRVQPENAKDGYLYFQLDTGDASANAPVLVIGLEKSRFFADAIPVRILLTIPEHGVSIQLTGTVSAQTVVLDVYKRQGLPRAARPAECSG